MPGIESIEDIIRTLETHPGWREKLLRTLLTDEFLALPARVERLTVEVAELRATTEKRFAELAQRFAELAQRFAELAQSTDAVARGLERLEKRFDGLNGRLDGEEYERDKRKYAIYIFHGGRDFAPDLHRAIAAATASGRLTWQEAESLARLDVIWEKDPGGEACLFAIETSITVDGTDVRRASERAALLAPLAGEGRRVIPVVIGKRFTSDEIEKRATERGVEWIVDEADPNVSYALDGLIKTPPGRVAPGGPGST